MTKSLKPKHVAPVIQPRLAFGNVDLPITKLLSRGEETELVTRLAKCRARIVQLLTPTIKRLKAQDRPTHFDQVLSFFAKSVAVPALARAEIQRHLHEYNAVKHRLVLANLPWVTKLARIERRRTSVAEEDLLQEGICGLLKAIDRFDVERGLRLMTYATWYIREAMQQARAKQSHLATLSAHDQTLLGQMEALQNEFRHKHERMAPESELSRLFQRNPKTLRRLLAIAAPTVSLDHGKDEGSLPIPAADPIDEYDRQEELHSAVDRLLEVLPLRERLVVTRRFGLDGAEPASLEVLGGDLNVSKERVRQLQRQALKRMQQHADTEALDLACA